MIRELMRQLNEDKRRWTAVGSKKRNALAVEAREKRLQ